MASILTQCLLDSICKTNTDLPSVRPYETTFNKSQRKFWFAYLKPRSWYYIDAWLICVHRPMSPWRVQMSWHQIGNPFISLLLSDGFSHKNNIVHPVIYLAYWSYVKWADICTIWDGDVTPMGNHGTVKCKPLICMHNNILPWHGVETTIYISGSSTDFQGSGMETTVFNGFIIYHLIVLRYKDKSWCVIMIFVYASLNIHTFIYNQRLNWYTCNISTSIIRFFSTEVNCNWHQVAFGKIV